MKERTAIKMKMMILLLGVLMDCTSSSCPSNCPNAPYHIIEPSTDNDEQIVSPTATSLNLRCSLNVTIPAGIMITWSLDGTILRTFTTTQAHTVTDTIQFFSGGAPQSGIYQCLFNDPNGYILRGNITVIVINVVQPSMDYYTTTFEESTRPIQLMCSLNINISFNVMITWLHNRTINVTSPDDVTQAGSTTTLVIRNPQPSDAGIYQCVFNNSVDGWILRRNIGLSPYHIVQPSTDSFMQTVFETATNATLRCSLNINIPASMTITWMLDGIALPSSNATQNDQTTILRLRSPPRDGVYQCIFNDAVGYILRTSITLVVLDIVDPSANAGIVNIFFDQSASLVQLTCLLNINIPSNIKVTWLHKDMVVMATQSNKIMQNGTNITLVIKNPQPSNAGDYACVLTDSVNGWILRRNVFLNESSVATTTTTNMFNHVSTSTAGTFPAITFISTTARFTAISMPSTSMSSTFSTATILSTSTTIPSTSTDATDETSSSSDIDIGVIIAPIMVIVVLALIVVAITIAFYWCRRRKQLYNTYDNVINLKAENPYYSTVKSTEKNKSDEAHVTNYKADINQEPLPMYALPDKLKKEKRKSTELQRSSVDFSYKPQHSPEMSVRPRQQTSSPDFEHDMELDIYAAPGIPERTEASTLFDNEDDENPIYSEAIDPTLLVGIVSCESMSDSDSVCPYASIYADPLPLTKSEGPPIVSNKNLEPLSQLGTGQFGEVILANTVGLSYQSLGIGDSDDSTISLKVAVKTLKASPSDDVQKAFEKEIKFMSRLKDQNVVRLLGICTTGKPFIMMEYMENGDLNNYLQQFEFTTKTENAPVENEIRMNTLVYISYQIASGMNYLSSCKFIHRDLAARNILVGADNAIKIADFGMSQNLYSAYYYKISGRICLPIRWMAYECFFGKFSVKTDVWAFGITLWEIFTLCRLQPFSEFSDKELIQDATKGAKRKIPYQTNICPNDIYNIMKSCFHHEPSERAGFNVLYDRLNECHSNLM